MGDRSRSAAQGEVESEISDLPARPLRRYAGAAGGGGAPITMTSTEAQNGFGRLLDIVARKGRVMITKHEVTRAVVLSVDEYESLVQPKAAALDALAAEFDALLARLQSPEAEAAMRDAFSMSPAELGRSAVAAAASD